MARESLMRELGGLVLGQVRDVLHRRSSAGLDAPLAEPPVVAQLMIEIRSDGSRTIARGALNDLRSGESAQVRAEGRTPRDLMLSLAGSLLSLPASFSDMSRRRHQSQRTSHELDRDAAPAPAAEAHSQAGTSGARPRGLD